MPHPFSLISTLSPESLDQPQCWLLAPCKALGACSSTSIIARRQHREAAQGRGSELGWCIMGGTCACWVAPARAPAHQRSRLGQQNRTRQHAGQLQQGCRRLWRGGGGRFGRGYTGCREAHVSLSGTPASRRLTFSPGASLAGWEDVAAAERSAPAAGCCSPGVTLPPSPPVTLQLHAVEATSPPADCWQSNLSAPGGQRASQAALRSAHDSRAAATAVPAASVAARSAMASERRMVMD